MKTTTQRTRQWTRGPKPPWPIEVDLHLHTTCSDGVLTPTELVERLATTSLKIVAITDHDSTDGIDETLECAASISDIKIIPGIELGTEEGISDVHVLGYFIDYNDRELQITLKNFREGRVVAARCTVEKLATLGIDVSWKRVQELASGAVGRPHIARAMVERGYVEDVPEAFDRYLGSNGVANIPRKKLSPSDGLEIIHRAGGVGVVAHPRTVQRLGTMVKKMAGDGLAGIEVYAEKYGDRERSRYMSLANRFDLVKCGGSDYHAFGTDNEVIPGSSGPPEDTPRLLLEKARLRHGERVGFVPKGLE